MYICRGKWCGFVSKKVERGLYCGGNWVGVSSSRALLLVYATELQCAANGNVGAVDVCAVVDREEVGVRVVGE